MTNDKVTIGHLPKIVFKLQLSDFNLLLTCEVLAGRVVNDQELWRQYWFQYSAKDNCFGSLRVITGNSSK